ncbi:MAG: TlpA family protein disulfide reductase [Peptococcaceae bacterium]|nr:TlpA family protein disulfide reductase [Peptococcaceae bacterium]
MQPFVAGWREKGFELVLVTRDNEQQVNNFMEQNDLNVMVLFDEQGKAGKAYRVSGVPMTVFIDSGGIVRHSTVGWGGEHSLEIFKGLVTLLTSDKE